MTNDDDGWIETDLREKDLDYGEKAGLQIYRNYKRAFEKHAVERLVVQLNQETLDLHDYGLIVERIASEDGRYIPVIVCAFADDILKEAFKKSLPEGIPGGGKKAMMGQFGPLSDLAKRIQLAHAFDVLSADLMTELDKVRSVRNQLAHSWAISDLNGFFGSGPLGDIHPVEKLLSAREEFLDLQGPFDPLTTFRIRMVWIVGRLIYEAAAYDRVKRAGLAPHRVLYGPPGPDWLTKVSKIALGATRKIIAAV